MVHLDIELVSHPFMSVCEAFLFATCLQQQYDFLVISAIYIVVGMIIILSVLTLLFLLSGIYPFSAVNSGCFFHMN